MKMDSANCKIKQDKMIQNNSFNQKHNKKYIIFTFWMQYLVALQTLLRRIQQVQWTINIFKTRFSVLGIHVQAQVISEYFLFFSNIKTFFILHVFTKFYFLHNSILKNKTPPQFWDYESVLMVNVKLLSREWTTCWV